MILEKLNWRYAVKRFDPFRKISAADWLVLEKSLHLCPSSYGLQPWQFWLIEDPEIRQKLRTASWNQSQVTDCSHFVVFVGKNRMDEDHIQKYLQQISEARQVPVESLDAFKKNIIKDLIHGERSKQISHWAQKQGYIAMGFLMETAALLSIDSCPMEGLNPVQYNKILNLEETDWSAYAAVACGYRHPDDLFQKNKKVRFQMTDVIKKI